MKLKRYMDNISPAENDKIDLLLADFFFSCNVSFCAVESNYFKKLVGALRPAYTPPNRKALAGSLLDKVHEGIVTRNRYVQSANKESALLVDGWTNSNANTHNVVVMLGTADDKKIFLESFNISETGEASSEIKEIVERAVVLAKERYDIDAYALVTDNAPNMVSCGNQLNLMYTTCYSHTGNLYAKDVLKISKYSDLLNKIMKVQKEFKKSGLESRLGKVGGHKPVLYSVIRFASVRNTVDSFLRNLPFMKKVAANEGEENTDHLKQPDQTIVQWLYSTPFIESATHLLALLDPIGKMINICQKGDISVADAVEEWLDLVANCPLELKRTLEDRCTKSNVFNSVSMTAHYFHPVYRGIKLSAAQRRMVDGYIFEELEAEALESCRLYDIEDETFAVLKRKKIKSPKSYWYHASRQGHVELSAFATKLLKIPASTAQLERLFSQWSFVHNETRNRLSEERSKKLVNVYFSLRTNDFVFVDDDLEDSDVE